MPNHTPREYALALAIEMDVVEGDVERIGEAYSYSRYRPRAASAKDERDLGEAWRSLRRKLLLWSLKRRLRHWRSGP